MNRKHGTQDQQEPMMKHDSSVVLFRKRSRPMKEHEEEDNVDDHAQLLSSEEENLWTWITEQLEVNNTQGIFKLHLQKPFTEKEEIPLSPNDSFLDKFLKIFPQVNNHLLNLILEGYFDESHSYIDW